MAGIFAVHVAADGVIGMPCLLRQRLSLAEPVGQRRQLLRVFQLCLLFLGQGVIIGVAGGLKRLVDRIPRRIVHAVQFRRVRQSIDHRLHVGHGLVLLYSRGLLLFFLFRRLIFLLCFPVCRVCRFLHGRGRLRCKIYCLCQCRCGHHCQAQSQHKKQACNSFSYVYVLLVSIFQTSGTSGLMCIYFGNIVPHFKKDLLLIARITVIST